MLLKLKDRGYVREVDKIARDAEAHKTQSKMLREAVIELSSIADKVQREHGIHSLQARKAYVVFLSAEYDYEDFEASNAGSRHHIDRLLRDILEAHPEALDWIAVTFKEWNVKTGFSVDLPWRTVEKNLPDYAAARATVIAHD